MNYKIACILIPILLSAPFTDIFAQSDMQREVRVVKPYTPSLNDAAKINLLPEFNDTATFTSRFDYSITPRHYSTAYSLEPIRAAKMTGLPLQRLYKSQFTLGLGNYLTPYADLTVNTLRKRNSAMGFYLKHHSSSGEVSLKDGDRVDAPFSDNQAELYGKRIFKSFVLEGNIFGSYTSNAYYGYNPYIDTVFEKGDNQQKVYLGGAKLKFYSTHSDSSRLIYNADVSAYYLEDGAKFSETGLNADLSFGKFIGDWYGSVDLNMEMYDRSGEIDSLDNTVIRVKPQMAKASGLWRFSVGLNTLFDSRGGNTIMNLYPDANFEFNIIRGVLIPYMGITGDSRVSSYRDLLAYNPYLLPGFIPENEDYSLVGYLGLKGSYSSRLAFDLNARYSRVLFMHSYISNDLDIQPVNQFRIIYEDADILSLSSEFRYNYNEALSFILRVKYHEYYNVKKEAFHRPGFEGSLAASYNLRDKFLVSTRLFYTGKRYAGTGLSDGSILRDEMPGYFDGNLKVQYRYTSLLSFFVRLNNFSATRYDNWYRYPVQRFQLMAGFSYAL